MQVGNVSISTIKRLWSVFYNLLANQRVDKDMQAQWTQQ